jgi:hypothetical protein
MFTFDGIVFANFPLTNIHTYILYMIRADYNDKDRVVNIIANSFADIKSVNYIIKQDKKSSKLLVAEIQESQFKERPVYLETYTVKNIFW